MDNSIWIFLLIIGFIFSAIGVSILLNQFFRQNRCYEQTQGIIAQGNFQAREAAFMLTFTVNGEEYRMPFAYGNHTAIGDIVTVVYAPTNIRRSSCYILEDVPRYRKMSVICIIAGIITILAGYTIFTASAVMQ